MSRQLEAIPGPNSTPQLHQRGPSTLGRLLDAIAEPALIHHAGRITSVNAALIDLIGHSEPRLLIGLGAHALVDAAPAEGHCGPALLTTPTGVRRVGLRAVPLQGDHSEGTLWLFSPTPQSASGGNRHAAELVDSLCQRMWSGEGLEPAAMMRTLVALMDLLEPDPDAPAEASADLVEAVQRLLPETELDVRARPALHMEPGALDELLAPALGDLPPGTRIRVDIDVAGHPVVILRHTAADVVPNPDNLGRVRALMGGPVRLGRVPGQGMRAPDPLPTGPGAPARDRGLTALLHRVCTPRPSRPALR